MRTHTGTHSLRGVLRAYILYVSAAGIVLLEVLAWLNEVINIVCHHIWRNDNGLDYLLYIWVKLVTQLSDVERSCSAVAFAAPGTLYSSLYLTSCVMQVS